MLRNGLIISWLFNLVVCLIASSAEVTTLNKDNWEKLAPQGKEVDAIYGDFVLRNDKIVAVIAQPIAGRNANMTVRGVGGCLIDLTLRDEPNDQLSAFYPGAGRYPFHAIDSATMLVDDKPSPTGGVGKSVTWRCRSSSKSGPQATVRYELADGDDFLTVTTFLANLSKATVSVERIDSMRADRTFTFAIDDATGMFIAEDDWFAQTVGLFAPKFDLKRASGGGVRISYEKEGSAKVELKAGEMTSYVRKLYPARNPLELRKHVASGAAEPTTITVADSDGPIAHAAVTVALKSGEKIGRGRTDKNGQLQTRLLAGVYNVAVTAIGRPDKSVEFTQPKAAGELKVLLETPGYVSAKITDDAGKPIPCKVAFHGIDGTKNPNWGPPSAANPVRNLFYSANGVFRQAISPGKYEVIISRGPEYDAAFREIEVKQGTDAELALKLKQVVDSTGWISSDFHGHSTPSGDNTSDQLGRVLNLLGEHIEFSPCTEHNRINSYTPHLRFLNAENFMATCTGMELTGNPLPANHQNAFPMIHKPHEQDGGGPVTDSNPVVQIERLAFWDDKSRKVVQGNHPNIPRVLGDKNEDGKPDGGFEPMLGFMDVIEVHPPAGIFTPAPADKDSKPSRMFCWMQLHNLGYRLPGVVNTDAHYNEHGSGWLRNYILSSADNPAEVSLSEIIEHTEAGHIVMSNGPFLEVLATSGKMIAHPGGDLKAATGKITLSVRVQCANWVDVNRVQVFVNGKPLKSLNFTRRTTADRFSTDVVRFEADLPVELKEDAHIIVATIGEGLTLGRVMGESAGRAEPVAVSNPIFVDVDGGGFLANGDNLGYELPVDMKKYPLHHHGGHDHPHSHDHDHDHDHEHLKKPATKEQG